MFVYDLDGHEMQGVSVNGPVEQEQALGPLGGELELESERIARLNRLEQGVRVRPTRRIKTKRNRQELAPGALEPVRTLAKIVAKAHFGLDDSAAIETSRLGHLQSTADKARRVPVHCQRLLALHKRLLAVGARGAHMRLAAQTLVEQQADWSRVALEYVDLSGHDVVDASRRQQLVRLAHIKVHVGAKIAQIALAAQLEQTDQFDHKFFQVTLVLESFFLRELLGSGAKYAHTTQIDQIGIVHIVDSKVNFGQRFTSTFIFDGALKAHFFARKTGKTSRSDHLQIVIHLDRTACRLHTPQTLLATQVPIVVVPHVQSAQLRIRLNIFLQRHYCDHFLCVTLLLVVHVAHNQLQRATVSQTALVRHSVPNGIRFSLLSVQQLGADQLILFFCRVGALSTRYGLNSEHVCVIGEREVVRLGVVGTVKVVDVELNGGRVSVLVDDESASMGRVEQVGRIVVDVVHLDCQVGVGL
ncbi:hypothetical protein BpHYR1_027864 [Brachionus plicatilis]|uniref:Uncharacterized protein n=1 Tax=Brachionus plicatilis TaxID=10195 RepID=A0A3M7SAM0_BRAPC|nr:hypothetical protein BpHYR1_027864 [Brachionus plicatilis]